MQKLKAPAANRVTIQAAARLWWINMATVAYLNPWIPRQRNCPRRPQTARPRGKGGVAYGNGLVRRALCNKFSPEILGAHGSGLQRRVLSRLLLHFRRIPLTRTSLGHWGIVGPARPAGAARTPRSGRGATLNFRQRVLWIEDDVIMGGRPGRRRPSAYAPLRIRSCRPCR